MIAAPARKDRTYGCQLWLYTAISINGQKGPPKLQEDNIIVVHTADDLLIVNITTQIGAMTIAVSHAPAHLMGSM